MAQEGETAKALKKARAAHKKRLSFFDWLCAPEEKYDHDETDVVAEAIKQEIWTDPLPLYLNQVTPYQRLENRLLCDVIDLASCGVAG
jgi:hypothetical protein